MFVHLSELNLCCITQEHYVFRHIKDDEIRSKHDGIKETIVEHDSNAKEGKEEI